MEDTTNENSMETKWGLNVSVWFLGLDIFEFSVRFGCVVSVLGQEEGYTVKYGLSLREIPRAQAIFSCVSQLES